jgi:hypothetical protein
MFWFSWWQNNAIFPNSVYLKLKTRHKMCNMCFMSVTSASEAFRCASTLVYTVHFFHHYSVIMPTSHVGWLAWNVKNFFVMVMVMVYVFQKQGRLNVLGYGFGLLITRLKYCLRTQMWINRSVSVPCVMLTHVSVLTFQIPILVQTAQKFTYSRHDFKHTNNSSWWWFQYSHHQGKISHVCTSLSQLIYSFILSMMLPCLWLKTSMYQASFLVVDYTFIPQILTLNGLKHIWKCSGRGFEYYVHDDELPHTSASLN